MCLIWLDLPYKDVEFALMLRTISFFKKKNANVLGVLIDRVMKIIFLVKRKIKSLSRKILIFFKRARHSLDTSKCIKIMCLADIDIGIRPKLTCHSQLQ